MRFRFLIGHARLCAACGNENAQGDRAAVEAANDGFYQAARYAFGPEPADNEVDRL